jgi:hypothetical protein
MEIDGRDATVEQLSTIAPAGYGHFTAMQVRQRRVRGLGLHLDRLGAANHEMFGAGWTPPWCSATSGTRWVSGPPMRRSACMSSRRRAAQRSW